MHFTYREPASEEDLQQGDILKRTPALDEILGKYHPYYINGDYTHFLVLTQSCDLVHRETVGPKAPYVSIAAVRPLGEVLKREADKYRTNDLLRLAAVLEQSKKSQLRDFVRKLLNNNHTEFFYLHSDPQVGLERSCAFLRLSVSIRSAEHYQSLSGARILSLEKEFQAKLGWLVGNLYSRVGTDDWAPTHYSEEKWAQTVEDILDESYTFIDDAKLKQAKKSPAARELTSRDDARLFIEKTKVPTKREEAIAAVVTVLAAEKLLDEASIEKARTHLQNTAALSAFFK